MLKTVTYDDATHVILPRKRTKKMHNAMLDTPSGIGGSPACVSHVYDEAIAADPPFTSMPNPDMTVIGDALCLALYHAKIAFQCRHANADKELDTVNSAIAAFKRLTGDV